MNGRRILKKMGFKRTEDFKDMKIEELIKLGEMGYTKEEIQKMQEEEKQTESVKPLTEQINQLENQIAEMKKGLEVNATRETVTEQAEQTDVVQQGLNILAGGANGNSEV